MLHEAVASYTPDMADLIDTEEEILADKYGVSLKVARQIMEDKKDAGIHHQAEILAPIISQLVSGENVQAQVYALAIAFGLDEVNGFHCQSEIAKKIGVTRALISHYVVCWRDVLAGKVAAFDCTKFRKHNHTRKIYAESAKDKWIQAKTAKIAKMQAKRKPKQ